MSDEKFVPPAVEIGEIVHYYHGTNSPGKDTVQPMAAVVTGVSQNGLLTLAIIPQDSHGFQLNESSIRHKDDPLARRAVEVDPDTGVWCQRPGQLTLAEVAELRQLLYPAPKLFAGAA